MSYTLDVLASIREHGTPAGYHAGCRGSICSGRAEIGMTCAEAATRYAGDWRYRKLVDAGLSAAEIVTRDVAAHVAAVEAERAQVAAERAAARAERAAERRSRVPVMEHLSAEPERLRGASVAPRHPKGWSREEIQAIQRLNGEGKNDSEISRILGRSISSVRDRRKALGLPAIRQTPHNLGQVEHGTWRGYAVHKCHEGCPASPSCAEVGRLYFRRRYHIRQGHGPVDGQARN